jgi:O-antigen/teichoic acid export membrane protein
MFLFSEWIIAGLYGLKFKESTAVLNYLLPGVVILTIFKVMNNDLAGKGKPWISMKAMFPALIINIVINMILIPIYGAKGAAISSTISYGIAGILFLLFYSKAVGLPIGLILRYKRKDFDPILNVIKNLSYNEGL